MKGISKSKLSRIVAAVLCIAMIFSAVPLMALADTTLQVTELEILNASFEEGGEDSVGKFPPHYTRGGGGTDVIIRVSSDYAYDGNYSLEITKNAGILGAGARTKPIEIEPGETYYVETMVRGLSQAGATASLYIEYWSSMEIDNVNVTNRVDHAIFYATPSDKWESLGGSLKAPENAVCITLLVYQASSSSGTFYFDNVRIFKQDEAFILYQIDRAVQGNDKNMLASVLGSGITGFSNVLNGNTIYYLAHFAEQRAAKGEPLSKEEIQSAINYVNENKSEMEIKVLNKATETLNKTMTLSKTGFIGIPDDAKEAADNIGARVEWVAVSGTDQDLFQISDNLLKLLSLPPFGSINGSAQLTLRFTLNKSTVDAIYDVTIEPYTDIIEYAMDQLTFETIANGNESPLAVITDLELPTTVEGLNVTWSSDNPAVVTNTGSIIRPGYDEQDVPVILSATFEGEKEKKIGLIVRSKSYDESKPLIIRNYDFENTMPGGKGDWISYEGSTFAVSDEVSFINWQSMKLWDTTVSSSVSVLSPSIFGVNEGDIVRAGVMMYAEGEACTPVVMVKFYNILAQECGNFEAYYDTAKLGTWQNVSLQAVAPVGAVTARILISSSNPSMGEIYFDAVRAEVLPLIKNGGFEYGAEYWTLNGTAEISNEQIISGNYSLKLDDGDTAVSSRINVIPGLEYTLGARISGEGKAQAKLRFFDAQGVKISEKVAKTTEEGLLWNLAYAPYSANFVEVELASEAGEIYFDEINLFVTFVGTDIADGSFERMAENDTTWKLPEQVLVPIQNPGFEEEGGWIATTTAGTMSITDSKAYEGSKSLKLIKTLSGGFGVRSDQLEITPGKSYTLSAKYQGTGTASAYIEFWNQNGAYPTDPNVTNRIKEKHIDFSLPSSEWKTLTFSETAPENAVYMTVLFYQKSGNPTGELYVDDVMVFTERLGEFDYSAAITEEFKTDGNVGLQLQAGESVDSNEIPVLAGKEYEAVVDVKAPAGAAVMTLNLYNHTGAQLGSYSVSNTMENEAEKLKISCVPPLNTFYAVVTLKAVGHTAYFDNANLYSITTSVSNASFENVNIYTSGPTPYNWSSFGDVSIRSAGDTDLNNIPGGVSTLLVFGKDGGVRSSMISTIEAGKSYTAGIKARMVSGGVALLRIDYFDSDFTLLGSSDTTVIAGNEYKHYTASGEAPDNSSYATVVVEPFAGIVQIDCAEFAPTILPVGTYTQLFIDDYVIESMEDTVRTFHQAQKSEPIIAPGGGNPWENNGAYMYGNVIYDKDEKIYKMWYSAFNANYVGGGDAASVMTCYATSTDGINWTRPNLGMVEYLGSTNNNIIGNYHIASVHKDYDEPDPAKRYKMTTYLHNGRYSVLYSPDGLNWTFSGVTIPGGDVITSAYDKTNDRYIALAKIGIARRDHHMTVSDDMSSWSVPILMNSLCDPIDAQNNVRADCYGMGFYPYEGVYIGFDWIFYITDHGRFMSGTIDNHLVFSRDLTEDWQRPTREAIIPLGPEGSIDDGMIFTASSAIEMGDEVWMYTGVWDGDHGLAFRDCAIIISKWRRDGFASLDTGSNGVITTKKLLMEGGKRLVLNADASEGQILVELLNSAGNPISGFTKDDCDPINTDSVSHTVSWNGNKDISSLEGRVVKVKIYAENSSIYSFGFKEEEGAEDIQAVAEDKEALTEELIKGNNPDLDNVTEDLNLVTSIPDGSGCDISWSSSNEAVIAPDGKVTRSEEGDEVVTLTATITRGVASDTKEFTVTVKQKEKDYILEIGSESAGGAGYTRTITISGAKADDLTGKYLVVQFTEGTGVNAKVTVIMMSALSQEATVSYQVAGTRVEAWLASGLPDLIGEDMGVTVYAYASTN